MPHMSFIRLNTWRRLLEPFVERDRIPHTRSPLALLLIAAWLLCFGALEASAQNLQYTNNATDKSKRSSFRVDPSTLGLNVQIPIADYPGRAGTSLPITLHYSSKLWRMKFKQGNDGTIGITYTTWVMPPWGEHTSSGWTTSLDEPTFTDDGLELYDTSGAPTTSCFSGCRYIRKLTVQMPGGSSHVLRHTSPIAQFSASQSGTYYAVDGSYYVLGSVSGPPATPTTFTDRNGNTQIFASPNAGRVGTAAIAAGRPVTDDGQPYVQTNTNVDAHEFGHAYAELVYCFDYKSPANPGGHDLKENIFSRNMSLEFANYTRRRTGSSERKRHN